MGDLLRQDGAFVLLAIGAVIGFFAGAAYRKFVKEKQGGPSEVAVAAVAAVPAASYAPSTQINPTHVIAAITAAVNQYRNDNLQGEINA